MIRYAFTANLLEGFGNWKKLSTAGQTFKRPQQPVKAFSWVYCALWQCFSSSSLIYQIDYSLFCKRVLLKSQGQPLNHLDEYYTQLPSVSVSTCDLLMTFLLLLATFRRIAELANFEAKNFRFWKWPVTPQMTYPLLLATVLTSDLRRNAELPKFLVSQLKTTSNPVTDVSFVVSNLSYFEPSLKCRLPKIVKECQRLPNLEQFKRICTLSLICATRKITQNNQSFQTTANRVF